MRATVLATWVLVGGVTALGLTGCGSSVPSQPQISHASTSASAAASVTASIEQTAPPVAGPKGATLEGYLSDGLTMSSSGDGEPTEQWYAVSVRWGSSETVLSDFLVVDSTVFDINGEVVSAGSAADKMAQLVRYLSPPAGAPPVTVSYEASANARMNSSADPPYRLSVATRIEVGAK